MTKPILILLRPWLILLVLALCGGSYLHADCKAPHYQVGRIYDNAKPAVLLNVSIQEGDFTLDGLLCLVNILKQRYQGPEVGVGIFSSHKAALNYFPLGVEWTKEGMLWASKQHATYWYDAQKHEEYLLLIPDGFSLEPNSPFNTRIDLPVTGRPSCKLEIHDRCLITFDHIGATSEDGSGTVTLTAQIEQGGFLSGVRIVDPQYRLD